MVSESQHCPDGDDARVSYKEILEMVRIRWQIKSNFLWWPGRKEECSCFLTLELKSIQNWQQNRYGENYYVRPGKIFFKFIVGTRTPLSEWRCCF